MYIKQKKVRRILGKKINQLNDIIAELDQLMTGMETEYYRVSIFGSARIPEDSHDYKQAYDLAYQLAKRGIDIVTGGGPGLMEAANRGAKEGSVKAVSYGLSIQLPFESDANSHLDVQYEHQRFSSRLDEFMRMSHAVVIAPGGIGTLLELFYTWQLIQVEHISERPIILMGEMWKGLLDWIHEGPLKSGLLSEKDYKRLRLAGDVQEVLDQLQPHIKDFETRKAKQDSES